MTIDYPFTWQGLHRIAGRCVRPGGITLTQKALDICKLSDGSFIADIGCGTGGTLEHLGRSGICNLLGVDASPRESRRTPENQLLSPRLLEVGGGFPSVVGKGNGAS